MSVGSNVVLRVLPLVDRVARTWNIVHPNLAQGRALAVMTRNTPPAGSDLDAALGTLDASELREVVRDVLRALDEPVLGRVVDALLVRAARGQSGWTPAPVGENEVTEVLAFSAAAERNGQADPTTVDAYLRRGASAFLRKDYASARRVLGALLRPIGDGTIYLGQHELIDEVLSTDTTECAARYVLSTYMISPSSDRAEAVHAAIEETRSIGNFLEPLRELERAAIEPLSDFDQFLPQWRALVARRQAAHRKSNWDTEEDRWLREVVQRLEGAEGLAKIARSTRRANDLRAWCRSLVDTGDWKAALLAFEEAAELVATEANVRGELLDGAALAAQCLGRKDLPERFERAWRANPSMLRLRRWLGSSSSARIFGKRVGDALGACPMHAIGQRALLHVLARDFARAAQLLAAAPGLGWSSAEHPGHLLFPLFARLVGKPREQCSPNVELRNHETSIEDLEETIITPQDLQLAAPEVELSLPLISGHPKKRDNARGVFDVIKENTSEEAQVHG